MGQHDGSDTSLRVVEMPGFWGELEHSAGPVANTSLRDMILPLWDLRTAAFEDGNRAKQKTTWRHHHPEVFDASSQKTIVVASPSCSSTAHTIPFANLRLETRACGTDPRNATGWTAKPGWEENRLHGGERCALDDEGGSSEESSPRPRFDA